MSIFYFLNNRLKTAERTPAIICNKFVINTLNYKATHMMTNYQPLLHKVGLSAN